MYVELQLFFFFSNSTFIKRKPSAKFFGVLKLYLSCYELTQVLSSPERNMHKIVIAAYMQTCQSFG